jgi:tRNA(Ile)-lysidine synthase
MRGTKKIKDFLIDAKVPRSERDSIPLLVCGDEILWVIGYTTSEPFKIKPDTRQYLYLRYVSDQTSS